MVESYEKSVVSAMTTASAEATATSAMPRSCHLCRLVRESIEHLLHRDSRLRGQGDLLLVLVEERQGDLHAVGQLVAAPFGPLAVPALLPLAVDRVPVG